MYTLIIVSGRNLTHAEINTLQDTVRTDTVGQLGVKLR
jgi:phenylalanyl-tRNA synthetase beta subunit